MVSLVHSGPVSFRLLQQGFWQSNPLQHHSDHGLDVHMKEHVKPTKRGELVINLFHPSIRVAEEHAKLPLSIKDKVNIYLFLLSSLLLLTLAYKSIYHLFLTTAGHSRT